MDFKFLKTFIQVLSEIFFKRTQNEKLAEISGWNSEKPLVETVEEVSNFYRQRLKDTKNFIELYILILIIQSNYPTNIENIKSTFSNQKSVENVELYKLKQKLDILDNEWNEKFEHEFNKFKEIQKQEQAVYKTTLPIEKDIYQKLINEMNLLIISLRQDNESSTKGKNSGFYKKFNEFIEEMKEISNIVIKVNQALSNLPDENYTDLLLSIEQNFKYIKNLVRYETKDIKLVDDKEVDLMTFQHPLLDDPKFKKLQKEALDEIRNIRNKSKGKNE